MPFVLPLLKLILLKEWVGSGRRPRGTRIAQLALDAGALACIAGAEIKRDTFSRLFLPQTLVMLSVGS